MTNPTTQWKRGQSGNPSGRKPGSGQVAKLREAIAEHVPGMLQMLITKALDGDVQAARILIDRCIPPLRAAELTQPVSLSGESLTDKGREVLQAIGAGQLPPVQGAQLLTAIAALSRVAETDELARRIQALEVVNHERD